LKATDEHFDKNQIYAIAMVLETNGQKEHVCRTGDIIEPLSFGAQKNKKMARPFDTVMSSRVCLSLLGLFVLMSSAEGSMWNETRRNILQKTHVKQQWDHKGLFFGFFSSFLTIHITTS
jgi:hypothetical protein